jgi:hypothetical protein
MVAEGQNPNEVGIMSQEENRKNRKDIDPPQSALPVSWASTPGHASAARPGSSAMRALPARFLEGTAWDEV